MGSECGSSDVRVTVAFECCIEESSVYFPQRKQDLNALEAYIVVLDGTLRLSRDGSIDANDLERLLSKVFDEISSAMNYN